MGSLLVDPSDSDDEHREGDTLIGQQCNRSASAPHVFQVTMVSDPDESVSEVDTEPQPFCQMPTFLGHHRVSALDFQDSYYTPRSKSSRAEKRSNDLRHEPCMASAWRVISFFSVVFVLPTILITLPLYARYHLYDDRSFTLSEGDVMSLHAFVSSFWCQGQTVVSNGSFSAYKLGVPLHKSTKPRLSKASVDLVLNHDEAEFWKLYLIEGSSVQLSACARWPGASLMIVKGEENFKKCFYIENNWSEEVQHKHPQVENGASVTKTAANYIVLREDSHADEGGEIIDPGNTFDSNLLKGIMNLRNRRALELPTNESDTGAIPHETPSLTSGSAQDAKHTTPVSLTDHPKIRKHKKTGVDGTVQEETGDRTVVHQKFKGSLKESKVKYGKNKTLQLPLGHSVSPESDTSIHVQQVERLNTGGGDQELAENKSEISGRNTLLLSILPNITDVTSGNSSYSSSEEFLEQCKKTILSIELNPLLNCRNNILSNSPELNLHKLDINVSDFYYIIVSSDNSLETNTITFDLVIKRQMYNVSGATDKCMNSTHCNIYFSFLNSEGLVVDFDSVNVTSNLSNFKTFETKSICEPRPAVYTVFILLVPFIIILFAFQ